MATNNNKTGNNWDDLFDDLFSEAFSDAIAQPASGAKKGAKPPGQPEQSEWFLAQSERDQAILAAAGWLEASPTMAIASRLVSGDRPILPAPSQRPSNCGKVRNAHLYDPATLKRLREQAKAAEVARYNLVCSVAATFARTNKSIALIDLAALTVAVGLKDEQKVIVALIAQRLNLPLECKEGKLVTTSKVPASPLHLKYAQAFNKAVAKVRADFAG